MNPLLAILNARRIPEAIETFQALTIDRLWITGHTEAGIQRAWPRILEKAKGYTHLLVVSDDTLVWQKAVDTVTGLLTEHPVATGYCNLDQRENAHLVNLCDNELPPPSPVERSYRFLTREQVAERGPVVETTFTGMCLTGMSIENWELFPFCAYSDPGYASDYHLSLRLQAQGIPVVSHVDAFVWHLKTKWSHTDPHPDRQLRLGDPSVTLERA